MTWLLLGGIAGAVVGPWGVAAVVAAWGGIWLRAAWSEAREGLGEAER